MSSGCVLDRPPSPPRFAHEIQRQVQNAAIFIFCAIPPLLALELAGRAVVLFMAGFKWLGFQRTLALVMVAWVLYVAAHADCYVAAHVDCYVAAHIGRRRLCAAADPRGV